MMRLKPSKCYQALTEHLSLPTHYDAIETGRKIQKTRTVIRSYQPTMMRLKQ